MITHLTQVIYKLLLCKQKTIHITVKSRRQFPEWPHRQCVGLAFRRSHVRVRTFPSLVICSPHCTVQYVDLRGTALCRVGGATSKLDLPSLTPLSVAVVVDCN